MFLKREDLLHTGAHKINNTIGQCLLTRRMGKPRVIAETGAGQHGVATAAAAARFGLECIVYMGAEDARRQHLNVERMKLLGAEVREVDAGSRTLKDAINEALRDWVTRVRDTHYVLGSVLGPHPFPTHGARLPPRDRRSRRARSSQRAAGGLPDVLVACVGGGSNAIGLFHAFLDDAAVRKVGVEAGGHGLASGPARRARPRAQRRRAARHAHAGAAGRARHDPRDALGLGRPRLPGARPRARVARRPGPGRVLVSATDDEALAAFEALSRLEGILPALESRARAGVGAARGARRSGRDTRVVVNLSGRGDKDVDEVLRVLGERKG